MSQRPTPIGGSLWEMLPFIQEGWKYEISAEGELASAFTGLEGDTIILNKGGSYRMKIPHRSQPGWILNVSAIFNNPTGQLNFILDNWKFDATPSQVRTLVSRSSFPHNFTIAINAWQNITAYGPLYGIQLDPVIALPIASENFSLGVSNPNSNLADKIECKVIAIGRIYIPPDKDEEDFVKWYNYRSRQLSEGTLKVSDRPT